MPATGTLTVNASGQLSTTTAPVVPSGSACTLTLTSNPSALPLPQGYVWKTPVISGTGNAFTVTLTMAQQSTNNTAVPVPTLSQWALYALGMLMLMAAAQAMRKQHGKR
ncbi:hypothetical protein SDC9_201723 [bioreactor metagenome]|uniref:Uncharacterized protein n=1 Tax=bioreactor metagenome TaxID=1076179 RepID=A0A645J0M0_9ZZZZ